MTLKESIAAQAPEHQKQESQDIYKVVLPLILQALKEPKKETDLAEALSVLPSQNKIWLKRAVSEGKVYKTRKPVRYSAAQNPLLENI